MFSGVPQDMIMISAICYDLICITLHMSYYVYISVSFYVYCINDIYLLFTFMHVPSVICPFILNFLKEKFFLASLQLSLLRIKKKNI